MGFHDYIEETRQIFDRLYPDNKITEIDYEGPTIVVYTKDPELFAKRDDLARQIAQEIRRRIAIRPDPSILLPEDQARDSIEKIIPKEAGLEDIYFEPDTGEVVIELDEPSIITARGTDYVQEIKSRTQWSPRIVRAPPMYSRTVKEVREFMREVKQERREFLHNLGVKLSGPPMVGETWVRLTALGGHSEVGRSATLVSTKNSKVLIDCGMMNVGPDADPWDAAPYLYVPEVQPLSSIDAVILTHAHLDHSGLLPLLFKYGYDGPVYMTQPTRDLAALLQNDYIKVARMEGGKVPYESKFIREELKHTITLRYGETTDITRDMRLTFYNAGHILGSASVHLHIGDGLYNVVLSGDVKFEKTWLFNPANNKFPRAETFMTESTYGGRDDYSFTREEATQTLIDVINRTRDRGGSVLIPVFAVGRSQEVMIVLEDAMRNGKIPQMDVYLDGMIMEATAIHAAYPEYLNKELREAIMVRKENPFLSPIFKKVETKEQREDIAENPESKIVLATSGMMNGGPVMEYFKAWSSNPKHTLVFVGYQADGTLGKKIQSGASEVTLSDEGRNVTYPIKMDVETAEGFSGHSTKKQLLAYIATMQPKPKRILVNHGDNGKTAEFARLVRQRFNIEAYALKNLETIRLL
ncbi:beta-CASP ribonuclease aCPSF1 [Thermoplasma sp. Kam2015]|uniref:beta-CASP ribonuclease aCPSF1 n=1 Tax=Thermoplasma sp. Kam2015 TaxID=2094122 RepID=UPI000DA0009C|nr:beta-CASP ribonuclease aCPSF1 [Thermoplasma sp. Kam2015]PYB68612.1 beta-CASP ribonuclease aCPSF1 [Thermoplasma sp. Kam2015]